MHPHQHFLNEFQVAINKLVPTVPNEIREKAQKKHDELLVNEQAKEEEIYVALVETGKEIYPYRTSFYTLSEPFYADVQKRLVYKKLNEALKSKFEAFVGDAKIHDATKKSKFEQEFSAEEIAQIETALVEAQPEIEAELAEKMDKNQYLEAVKQAWERAVLIEQAIEQLRKMGNDNPEWTEQINGKVKEFEESWSITERDLTLEEVQKEVENWEGIINAVDNFSTKSGQPTLDTPTNQQ